MSVYLAAGNFFGSENDFDVVDGFPLSSGFGPNGFDRLPQPKIKYCMMIPMMFEATQYSASPLGKDNVMNANITGINISII